NLPSSSPDSSSSAGVTRPAPVRSPPPCPSLIPCSRPASRLPHDSSKHNFLDKCPTVFCDHRLQHVLVQTQVRHQFPQPRVFIPQLLRFLRLAHVHPAVLRLPRVDRVLGHAYFPRHIFGLASCFQLLQRSDHLRFCVLAHRHRFFPFLSSEIILGCVRKEGIRSIEWRSFSNFAFEFCRCVKGPNSRIVPEYSPPLIQQLNGRKPTYHH